MRLKFFSILGKDTTYACETHFFLLVNSERIIKKSCEFYHEISCDKTQFSLLFLVHDEYNIEK